jgi:hypothetical protein
MIYGPRCFPAARGIDAPLVVCGRGERKRNCPPYRPAAPLTSAESFKVLSASCLGLADHFGRTKCLAAMIIDHYGLMGMEKNPVTLQRAIGVALVVGGVVVFRLSSSAASTP